MPCEQVPAGDPQVSPKVLTTSLCGTGSYPHQALSFVVYSGSHYKAGWISVTGVGPSPACSTDSHGNLQHFTLLHQSWPMTMTPRPPHKVTMGQRHLPVFLSPDH